MEHRHIRTSESFHREIRCEVTRNAVIPKPEYGIRRPQPICPVLEILQSIQGMVKDAFIAEESSSVVEQLVSELFIIGRSNVSVRCSWLHWWWWNGWGSALSFTASIFRCPSGSIIATCASSIFGRWSCWWRWCWIRFFQPLPQLS